MHQKWSVRNGHYSKHCIQSLTHARGREVHKSSLPFKKYPPRLIVKMVYNIVFWLNSFDTKTAYTQQSAQGPY